MWPFIYGLLTALMLIMAIAIIIMIVILVGGAIFFILYKIYEAYEDYSLDIANGRKKEPEWIIKLKNKLKRNKKILKIGGIKATEFIEV